MKVRLLSRPMVTASFAALILVLWSGQASAASARTSAKSGSPTSQGLDVSYPQCPANSLPGGEAFAIVGLNDGLANNYNPCFGTEFTYASSLNAKTKLAPTELYINTGDPGNGVADWPSPNQMGALGSDGVSNPYGSCAFAQGSIGAGADSTACAFAYGYDMVGGIKFSGGIVVGDLQDFSQATGGKALYNYPVWLDVETGNSWQSGSPGLAMNIADLQGMVAAINHASGTTSAKPVGVYSTGYQWGQITGTPKAGQAGSLANAPTWIPGARKQSGAISNCSLPSFTGGPVTVTQWFGQPYDGDYSCLG